ncbi:MAG TPA: heme biosynthesis HemY N-terminal domain-containing protein [Pseudolabrys sp.]|nr:heme biosynthesis HemY N-terminal domain-containing protein [Pseudolabrys sp.]
MIRVVWFLLVVGLLALGVVWFADRPGDVAITWMGYRIETSVMVALVGVLIVVVAAMLLWTILRGIARAPDQVSLFMRQRRAMRGYLAVTRGLIAIGAGDARLAQRSAAQANRLSPEEPLALLLSAQSAQMAGDRPGAERAFRAMVARPETKLLGLRGLYVEAKRRADANAARLFAEEAVKVEPALGWAGQAVLDDRCAAADWAGALSALDNMKPALDKATYRRHRAVLLTAEALARADKDRAGALSLVAEAVKLAPDLVPASALAGRLLAEGNELRKAGRILETTWKASPHPDIAETYANLRFGASARDRLARIQKLVAKEPGGIEGALAIARAALEAHEFARAREALAPYLAAPTQRIAALMAEIEQTEHGDEGRAREWTARAVRAAPDPAWTADGVVSEHWMPVSPSGRLDGFQWKVPLAEIGFTRPVIDLAAPAAPAQAPSIEEATPAAVEAEEAPVNEAAKAPPSPVKPETRPAAKPVEAVIPLVHAPDDPGPESAPEPEPLSIPAGQPDPWRRLRQLFR